MCGSGACAVTALSRVSPQFTPCVAAARPAVHAASSLTRRTGAPGFWYLRVRIGRDRDDDPGSNGRSIGLP
jgi:hypothetical protein